MFGDGARWDQLLTQPRAICAHGRGAMLTTRLSDLTHQTKVCGGSKDKGSHSASSKGLHHPSVNDADEAGTDW